MSSFHNIFHHTFPAAMYLSYLKTASTEEHMDTATDADVAQSAPLSDDQVRNNAGGLGWKVRDIDRVRRFLVLGSEGGTYYTKEQKLTRENAKTIDKLIKDGKGEEVVKTIVEFSVEGRTAKQNSILFALALCARQDDDIKTKKAAYAALNAVCRIPTHLFLFVEYCEAMSKGTGWGRAHRRGVQNWYNNFTDDPKKLANHVTKYRNRNGWTHVDLLRLSHTKPASDGISTVLRYVIKGLDEAKKKHCPPNADVAKEVKKVIKFLQAVEDMKRATSDDMVVQLIHEHQLVREHIPTNFLNCVKVWQALLNKMPMTAMIRNLGKMSSIDLINEKSEEAKMIIDRLYNEEALRQARIHPFNALVALHTYSAGHGDKGKLTWTTNPDIAKALNAAFYKSFKFVEPTGKRYLLAIDVSGSMDCGSILGSSNITPRSGAAALAMVTARTEQNHTFLGFSDRLVPLNINKHMNLEQVIEVINQVPMGNTDCAQPMIWAKKQNKLIDCFIVYTDCETWAGKIHPAEALRQYRKHSGIWDAKLIVCAMTSGGFTIADPEDPGMLDMAGFDSAGPEIMRNFVTQTYES